MGVMPIKKLLLNRLMNPDAQVSFKGFRLEDGMVAAIYKVGLPGAWFAMWVAETAAMLYVLWAMRRELKNKVEPLK